jgi:hypothetical protein
MICIFLETFSTPFLAALIILPALVSSYPSFSSFVSLASSLEIPYPHGLLTYLLDLLLHLKQVLLQNNLTLDNAIPKPLVCYSKSLVIISNLSLQV